METSTKLQELCAERDRLIAQLDRDELSHTEEVETLFDLFALAPEIEELEMRLRVEECRTSYFG